MCARWSPALQDEVRRLSESGRWRKAESVLRRAMAADPGGLGPRHSLFRGLVQRGRYSEAFAVGEAILDLEVSPRSVRPLLWPWDPAAFDALKARHLSILRRLRGPWAAHYKTILSNDPRMMAGFARFPARRYGWMRLTEGRRWLERGLWSRAVATLRRCSQALPDDPIPHGFIAEALACAGRPDDALARLGAAARRLHAGRGELLAWKGGIELWIGRYADAARTLDRAWKLRARWAPCWRAGANVMLGRHAEALKDAERALRVYPADEEAMVWRGEALRKMGRHAEALSALASVGAGNPWAAVNRGLAYAAVGDAAAARRELDGLPADLRRRFRSEAGRGGGPQEVLEAGLRLARGFRRFRSFLEALWVGPGWGRAFRTAMPKR